MTEPVTVEAQERAAPMIPSGAWLLVMVWAAALGGALAWAFFDRDAEFLVFGSAACLIVTLPMLSSRYDLVSPWSMVALTIYVGCGVRSWFVAHGVDGGRSIDALFLLGEGPSFFVWPSLLYLSALALMAIACNRRAKATEPRRWTGYEFGPLLHMVVLGCAAIGFGAFYMYAQQTGGLDPSGLSAKRTRIDSLDVGIGYESFGHLRAVNKLSSVAFWVLLAHFAAKGVRHSLLTLRGWALLALFVNAAALPIYASTRADVAWLLIVAVAIELCLSKSRARTRRIIMWGAVAVVVILSALTIMRTTAQTSEQMTSSEAVGEAFIFNRNFADIATTSQIIRAVPERLPYRYGETITAWLAAPVPRSVWPDKPLISSGPEIGIRLFGNEYAGVPPGFVGEMYWNFGLLGVLIGSALFGWLVRRLQNRYAAAASRSPAAALMLCVVVLRFGADALTVGIGYGLFNAVVSAGLLYVVLLFAGWSPRPKPVTPVRAVGGGRWQRVRV